jgi:hypothetical protein
MLILEIVNPVKLTVGLGTNSCFYRITGFRPDLT